MAAKLVKNLTLGRHRSKVIGGYPDKILSLQTHSTTRAQTGQGVPQDPVGANEALPARWVPKMRPGSCPADLALRGDKGDGPGPEPWGRGACDLRIFQGLTFCVVACRGSGGDARSSGSKNCKALPDVVRTSSATYTGALVVALRAAFAAVCCVCRFMLHNPVSTPGPFLRGTTSFVLSILQRQRLFQSELIKTTLKSKPSFWAEF